MTVYMLDTNTVSYLIKGHPSVAAHLVSVPMASICISAVTEGELRFGLAKHPEAKRLHDTVKELLRRVDVFPWDSAVAECCGLVRSDMEHQGKVLASLDLLIASHALSVGAVLVTNDRAFGFVAGLNVEDWTN